MPDGDMATEPRSHIAVRLYRPVGGRAADDETEVRLVVEMTNRLLPVAAIALLVSIGCIILETA